MLELFCSSQTDDDDADVMKVKGEVLEQNLRGLIWTDRCDRCHQQEPVEPEASGQAGSGGPVGPGLMSEGGVLLISEVLLEHLGSEGEHSLVLLLEGQTAVWTMIGWILDQNICRV